MVLIAITRSQYALLERGSNSGVRTGCDIGELRGLASGVYLVLRGHTSPGGADCMKDERAAAFFDIATFVVLVWAYIGSGFEQLCDQ
jgi:hypothetical protein